jgi:alkyl hydroperoxide reductase subunit AhpC
VIANFQADSTTGPIDLYAYLNSQWGVIVSYPTVMTEQCMAEMAEAQSMAPAVKLLSLTCADSTAAQAFVTETEQVYNVAVVTPVISDPSRAIAGDWGMLSASEVSEDGDALTCRCVYIVGGDMRLKLFLKYPTENERNFAEILVTVANLQRKDALEQEQATLVTQLQEASNEMTPAATDGSELDMTPAATDAISPPPSPADHSMNPASTSTTTFSPTVDGHLNGRLR